MKELQSIIKAEKSKPRTSDFNIDKTSAKRVITIDIQKLEHSLKMKDVGKARTLRSSLWTVTYLQLYV